MEKFFYNKFCIAAISGGGGKTLLSLGLARLLVNEGHIVKPFKKGPDYIDAQWLAQAAKNTASNLDLFFLPRERIKSRFDAALKRLINASAHSPVALLEGNRGIYDGMDEAGSCSTAELCRVLECPVILSIDCAKVTRTIVAVLQGVLNFEKNLNIIGIILNKIGSPRHEKMIASLVETRTNARVFGALPRLPFNPLPERQMGLVFSRQNAEANEMMLENLAARIKEHIDWRELLGATRFCLEVSENSSLPESGPQKFEKADNISARLASGVCAPTIGYVLDDALWFYYPENLKAIEEAGGRLLKLSMLDDSAQSLEKWSRIDGLYIGGGFPEEHLERIAASRVTGLIARLGEKGLPIYAECGGLMILSEKIMKNGRAYRMAGLIPASVQWHERPQGLGYAEARVIAENPYFAVSTRLKGHEFHYSSCALNENDRRFALGLTRGKGIQANDAKNPEYLAFDGYCKGTLWASYMHLFAPAVPEWAPNLVRTAANHALASTADRGQRTFNN